MKKTTTKMLGLTFWACLVLSLCGMTACTAADQSAFKAGLSEVLRVAVAVCKPVVAVDRAAQAAGITSGGDTGDEEPHTIDGEDPLDGE